MSELCQNLSHSKWDCKYHVVFVPERRRKVLFGKTRRQLGEIFHALARQKECQILEGHLMPDHLHMCIAIPPKHPVASVMGFLKGKGLSRLRGYAARSGISRVSISGPESMLCPRSGSSWGKSANTSANKKRRMDRRETSDSVNEGAPRATPELNVTAFEAVQLIKLPASREMSDYVLALLSCDEMQCLMTPRELQALDHKG